VLAAAQRLRSAADFARVTRSGRRSRRGSLVVYLDRSADDSGRSNTRAGLIVGKRVGGSVVRHRVSRRLRAQLAQQLDAVPAGSTIVVRALPQAAEASSARLGADLGAALRRLTTS